MYCLLAEKKGKIFAQKALEYVCIYNRHNEIEKSGQLEYEYEEREINEYLKEIKIDNHLIQFATINLSVEELKGLFGFE